MGIRSEDVVEFLRLRGFTLLGEGISILDVPPTTWARRDMEVTFDQGWEFADLRDIERWWGSQRGGAALFQDLLAWARANNRIIAE